MILRNRPAFTFFSPCVKGHNNPQDHITAKGEAVYAYTHMSKSYWLVGIILVAVLAGALYVWNVGSSAPPAPQTHTFSITVRDRTVVGGMADFTARVGDTVSISITADESDELHLHGYDRHIDFATDTPATLTFVADQSGRFPFEMEASATELGVLNVLP